jgi:hypothetical protein
MLSNQGGRATRPGAREDILMLRQVTTKRDPNTIARDTRAERALLG